MSSYVNYVLQNIYMKNSFKIICRNSKLSLIQGQTVQRLIEQNCPNTRIEVLSKPSQGDLDQTTPLYQMGDKNIFTKDIQAVLESGNADFAVHSMKDVSAEKLTDPNFKIALVERNDVRDVVIFQNNILEKLKMGQPIRLGTSSLRRAELIPPFLQKALPQLAETPIQIEILNIRGNVDTRLRKLRKGDYDAIALAAAGLNRLLEHEPIVAELLKGLPKMLLPMTEVPPAAGQGALLVECLATNAAAAALLPAIHQPDLMSNLLKERAFAHQYGAGCHQRFGVVNVDFKGLNFSILKGKSGNQSINVFHFENKLTALIAGKKLVSTTDFMRDFFDYQYFTIDENFINKLQKVETIFVAHHRTATDSKILNILKSKTIWASGTKTWFQLAQKGIWVSGCADGFGFESLLPVFERPLFHLLKKNILILTNEAAEAHWQPTYQTASSYRLIPHLTEAVSAAMQTADAIFWTNFEQYLISKPLLKPHLIHACAAGKTAELFIKQGITPIIFPNIKSFLN
jgi:hydroxymethylbilane synthase